MFNGGEEGKAWMEGGGHDNEVAHYSHDNQLRCKRLRPTQSDGFVRKSNMYVMDDSNQI